MIAIRRPFGELMVPSKVEGLMATSKSSGRLAICEEEGINNHQSTINNKQSQTEDIKTWELQD
jgi:hypothetical protein